MDGAAGMAWGQQTPGGPDCNVFGKYRCPVSLRQDVDLMGGGETWASLVKVN